MRLKIGEYEVPNHVLRYVFLYRAAPVSFGGVLVGPEGSRIKEMLEKVSHSNVISYEAVDENGVFATGYCNVRSLRFDCSNKKITRFSGELVRPFEQDYWWGLSDNLAKRLSLSRDLH